MTYVVAWLLFPALLAALSLGCGLLVEQAAGRRLGMLLLPVGFAGVVVVAQFAPLSDATAELAAPAVVGCATAGLLLGLRLSRLRGIDGWGAVAGAAAFAVYAAPVALALEPTFAGYIKLDDTATYFAMLDRLGEHGRSLDGLPPSTYEATLATTIAYGYPLGSLVPLAVGSTLTGLDPAWLFQPYIAVLGGLLALPLYALTAGVVNPRPLRAVVAFVAAQPALLFGYALWGGLKEVGAAALVTLVAALVPSLWGSGRARELLPLAVAGAAFVGFLSLAGAVWLAPPLVLAAVLLTRRAPPRLAFRRVGWLAVLGIVLALPELVAAATWLPRAASFTEGQLGNLVGPLSVLQVAGIWPTGDFRFRPDERAPTYVLVAVAAGSAALGLAWAWRRRALAFLAYALAVGIGCALFLAIGSPWVEAKALAMASPALVLAALVAAARLAEARRRVAAALLGAAVVGGVGWSNVLAYGEVWLAPHGQLAELERLGTLVAGRGPTLMTDYQPYGVRHFLRAGAPEGVSELRRRPIELREGGVVPRGLSVDVDALAPAPVSVYRTLVLRRSPSASRPPSTYRRSWRGRYYDVWERFPGRIGRVVARLPLGRGPQPVAPVDCGELGRLAAAAGSRGHIVAASRAPAALVEVEAVHPVDAWKTDAAGRGLLTPLASGTVEGTVEVAAAGPYAVWVGGSFRGRVRVEVAGAAAGEASAHLEHSDGQYTLLGSRSLRPGRHRVVLRYDERPLEPGTGGARFALGPVALSREEPWRLRAVAPRAARSLCGETLDWVEAVRRCVGRTAS